MFLSEYLLLIIKIYSISREYLAFAFLVTQDMYCSPGNFVCSSGTSGILLVQLFGEQNTQIDDPIKQCNSINNYHDRTNLIVTLLDNTIYTLRIELYCTQTSDYQHEDLAERNCNHAHYLDMWIDFNNDGIFDETRERMISTDSYEDGYRKNNYDFTINIPNIDGRNYINGQHRMRIVLSQDETNRKPCYNTGYGEVRDYTIQIGPKYIY